MPNTPTPEELVARARAMIPVLRERAAAQDAERRVLKETIADFKKAGFFRIYQPKRWGGYEMSPRVFSEVQMALAEGDMSAAWVHGIVGVHNFHLALFDDRAARDVWGEDQDVLIASPYSPGRAVKVEGGYRFSGRWKFSSGTDHCDWIFLGGAVESEDGTPAGFAESRTFLLPRKDYQIVDTWHVVGLKGTGSQDIVVNDVFVPEYRTHKQADALAWTSPGHAVNPGPLYRLPFWQVFLRAVSTSAIGGLQGMADAFIQYGRSRVNVVGAQTARDPDAQLAVAEALAAVDEMKATLNRNFAAMEAHVAAGTIPPVADRMRWKFQCGAVPERCHGIAHKLFRASGGSGIFMTQPFGRAYTDLLAMCNHYANQWQVSGRHWGGVMMGLESADPLL
jgi:3-hydroxy-9,10-secoandrosta-1,3,5(10)-triene-9,17-dione monooxygenase